MAELKVKVVKCGEITPQLTEAFEGLEKNGLEPVWVTSQQCLKVASREADSVYVIDPFESEVFDHLLSKESRLYGPQCVLSCLLSQTALPRVRRPIYNMAMNGLLISCTNLAKSVREDIHNKVKLMCGEVSGVFTKEITHLVTNEVGSKKYHVAASLGTSIMTTQWVEQVWKESRLRHVHGKDAEFAQYKCGIFKGYVITVSGLQERNKLAKLIDSEGGRYTGEMKINDCTHLVINEPKGQKYEFAKRWKIHIVHSSWLYESLDSGYCKDELQYQLDGHLSSTPTKDKNGRPPSLADVSSINDMSRITNDVSGVDETALRQTGMGTSIDLTSLPTMGESTMNADINVAPPPRSSTDCAALDNLDVTKIKAGMFLDGCMIYLSGHYGNSLEKLRKLINKGGATRFDQISESITHFIMGQCVQDDIDTLVSHGHRPDIVSASWLVDSCVEKERLPESDYQCYTLPPVDPTSPIPAKRSKLSLSRASSLNDTKTPSTQKTAPSVATPAPEMDDVMTQYLPPQGDNSTMEVDPVQNISNDETHLDPHGTGEATMSGLLFHGKTFLIDGFDQQITHEMTELIKENGGQVSSENSLTIADYAVLPSLGCDVKLSVKEVVTNIWLESCLEEDTILPVGDNNLYAPLELKAGAKPLEGCVLSVSGYSGRERDCLMNLAEIMGATCQEYFVRRANKGLLASTHLVVNEPEGSKYAAAIKWKLPALHKKWLFACARSGQKCNENDYLIDKLYNESTDTTVMDTTNTRVEFRAEEKENIHKANVLSPLATADGRVSSPVNAQGRVNSPVTVEDRVQHNSQSAKDEAPPVGRQLVENQGEISGKRSPTSLKVESTSFKTPVAMKADNNRVRQLKQENKTPLRSSPRSKAGIDTPGKFLKKDVQYKPSFDVEEFLSALDTPEGQARSRKRAHARKCSLPLDELLGQQLAIAIKNSTLADGEERKTITSQITQDIPLSQPSAPLHGVVIAVSKKLSSKQSEYNNMAASLGADYRWTYDKSCTHFIFQGRANDTTKEFRLARDQGKCIVSPHWLTMCSEQQARVDEALFPHNFNPSMQLAVVKTKQETPARNTRRSVRNKQEVVPMAEPVKSPRKDRESAASRSDSPTEPIGTTKNESSVSLAVENPAEGATRKDKPAFSSTSDSDDEMVQACVDAEQPEDVAGNMAMNDISKQLKSAIEATKAQKSSRRKSRQRNNGNNQLNTSSEQSTSSRSRPSSRQRQRTTRSTGKVSPALMLNTEASQSVQVTWDDPTGRLEQIKLAEALERANSPTQNSESLSPAPVNAQYSDVDEEGGGRRSGNDSDTIQFRFQDVTSVTPAVKSPPDHRTPTPEAPSLAFPVIQPGVRVQSPQPVVMVETESEPFVVERPSPVFLFSGMSPQERDHYGAIVEQLGGRVLDSLYYDADCTHLVVGSPTRNEKFLACIATGSWVLHKSYFEACDQEKRFVDEEQFEWGGPGTESLLMSLSNQASKLAQSAHRWRVRIEQETRRSGSGGSSGRGAFREWCVILCTSKNDNFKRLLEAGGARVVSTRPPFNNLSQVTHAFLELTKIKYEVNLNRLLEAGIPCVKPEYLAAFLSDDPVPSVSDHYINEVKEMMTSGNNDSSRRKRKPADIETPSKRTRRQ